MKKCPFCGKGSLVRKTKQETFKYKGQKLRLPQPGDYCPSCGEGILNGSDLKSTRKAIHDWQAKVDKFLTSDEVKAIRIKLNLTQREAAELFGGGANAFSRYERGEALQLRSTDNLLRLLSKHPTLLSELPRTEAA